MKTIKDYADLVKEKHALNTTIAPVETDLTSASKTYAVGQKFIHDGVLYQAKTPIAQGAALVLNTNYEAADDVSSEIQTLTNKLSDEVETRAKTGVHNFWNNSAYMSVNHANASNNGFTNADADSRTEFWFRVRAFDASGTQIGSALASDEISSTGKKSYNMTVPNGTKSLDIRHNGAQVVIGITVPFNGEPGDYTMAFDLNGYNPTTVGGLDVQNIVLSLATDKATDFTPYAMTNRELTQNVEGLEETAETIVGTSPSVAIKRVGKSCRVYVYLSGLSESASNVVIGDITDDSFVPQDIFAILPAYSASAPYQPIGSLWIGKSNKRLTLYKQSADTACYIYGMYQA